MNVIPGHPVTGLMTIATNDMPATIPMALISWLAAMQCDQPSAPRLFCVDAFRRRLGAYSVSVHCWFLFFIPSVTPKFQVYARLLWKTEANVELPQDT